jgi:hypothetical protein
VGNAGSANGLYGVTTSGGRAGVRGSYSAGTSDTPIAPAGVWGDSSDGYGGFFSNNNGTYSTLWLRNQSASGSVIEAYGNNSGDMEFRVTSGGNVYADGTFYCGQSINDAAGDLNETEIAPCLVDDVPADFAEVLPAKGGAEPGDVMVIAPDGQLARSSAPYQAAVAGVHSTRPSYIGGASNLGQAGYAPLAVVGIVPVKASAENGPIQPGDLLTTSSIPGHAMRCEGVERCFGRTIGKALEGLESGNGVIMMLVMLQ